MGTSRLKNQEEENTNAACVEALPLSPHHSR